MTNRWNNQADFAVAMKAAAWEAVRRAAHISTLSTVSTGIRLSCATTAAAQVNLVDDHDVANVDKDVIYRSVYALAFAQGNDAFVQQEIDKAWLEYAGMGMKAAA